MAGCDGLRYQGWCGMPKSKGLWPISGCSFGLPIHPGLSPQLSRVYEFPYVCQLIYYKLCTQLLYCHLGGLSVHRGWMWSPCQVSPVWLLYNLSLLALQALSISQQSLTSQGNVRCVQIHRVTLGPRIAITFGIRCSSTHPRGYHRSGHLAPPHDIKIWFVSD